MRFTLPAPNVSDLEPGLAAEFGDDMAREFANEIAAAVPSDAWVDLVHPKLMTESKRQMMNRAQIAIIGLPGMASAISHAKDGGLDMSAGEEVQFFLSSGVDAAALADARSEQEAARILAYASAWSFGDVTADVLNSLPACFRTEIDHRIDQIEKACGKPQLETEISPEPDSPTSP